MTTRTAFTAAVASQLGKVVCWAKRGPDCFDCSGLAAWCLEQVGASKSLRFDHNAQRFHDESREIEENLALPGDLLFYGVPGVGTLGKPSVVHVAVVVAGGRCISADGATSRILLPEVAAQNPLNRVRLHDNFHFRRDLPYFSVRRNHWVDDLDLVTR